MYRTLNVLNSILCVIMLLWYGAWLYTYAQAAQLLEGQKKDSFAVVAIIFVMALIEVFFSIMAIFASQERNSTYMQVCDSGWETFEI